MSPHRKPRKSTKNIKRSAPKVQGRKKAGLIFPESSSPEGLGHSSVAQFGDNDADKAVREFLQNSLDAAVEVGRSAKIHVTVEYIEQKDIPSFSEYKKALESAIQAVKDCGGYNQNAKQVAERLLGALTKKKIPVLFVLDNGAGFDETGFSGVLGDGVSYKKNEAGAAGSFGNGHLTAFPASDLRYIFYAGAHKPSKTEDIVCGCVGHAIVATHANKKGHSTGKDGFWVKDIKNNVLFGGKFIPAKGDEIPPFIHQKIESIKSSSETGSMVAILAFNNFGKKRGFNLSDEITRISALHFFAAVHEENMEVSIGTNGDSEVLTKKKLRGVLYEHRDNKRASVQGFPSGAVAWQAYNTLVGGEKVTAKTEHGNVNIRLLKHEQGDHSVVLCRDGMYITKIIKNLGRSEFSLKEPFNAVICLDKDADDAYRVIKAAESNLHNKLESNRLSAEDVKILNKVTEGIASAIKGKVKDEETDSWSPSEFMSIVHGENKGELKGTDIRSSRSDSVTGSGKSSSTGTGAGTGSESKPVRRPGRVKISSRRILPDKMRVVIMTEKDCDDVEFNMTVDKGRDLSCSGQLENAGWEKIKIRNINVDGQGVFEATGDRESVNIGKIDANKRMILNIEYDPPDTRGDYTVDFAFERQTDGGLEGGSQS